MQEAEVSLRVALYYIKNGLTDKDVDSIFQCAVPVAGSVENFGDYHLVKLAFPIWYGCAPNVVNTFCKEYDWTGKKVAAVATSGGSGIGKTADKLKQYVEGAVSVDAKLVHSDMEVKNFAESLQMHE